MTKIKAHNRERGRGRPRNPEELRRVAVLLGKDHVAFLDAAEGNRSAALREIVQAAMKGPGREGGKGRES